MRSNGQEGAENRRMEDELLERRLSVPYIKLKFSLIFPEGAELVREKVSALRGGMGEMLLRQNCIGGRDCMHCRFSDACIVYKTLYTRMERSPAFMQGENSVGYLIECENSRTYFQPDSGFFFYLTLFGDNVASFSLYLQAFYQLGQVGLGKQNARYRIDEVRTTQGNLIMRDNRVYVENYKTETVCDYVRRRQEELAIAGCANELTFHSPLCLKYQGEFIREFRAEAIFPALFRRVMIMDYFVREYIDHPDLGGTELPVIVEQSAAMRTVPRFSARKGEKMYLQGIVGKMVFADIPDIYIPYLLAGELFHIGKNTSFGFGRYTLR